MSIAGPIVFVIEREDVEAGNTVTVEEFLTSLISSPAEARQHFQNIDLAFNGYDEDPRELFEIDRVRDFVHELDRKIPYWLYFMNLSYPGLYAIGMCFLVPELTDEARAELHPHQLQRLFENRWAPALNKIGAWTGFTESEIDLLLIRCLDYFIKGREKPPIVN